MNAKWRVIATLLGAAGMANAAFVTIGDAGNDPDGTGGYGAVGYTYKISATEVTIAEFAASGAGDGDENYWNDGTNGTVGTTAPASYVSLYEAKKYCNYLTEQANGGSSDYNLYSSDGAGAGSYTRADAISDGITVYGVPTEDEWYKAAYYTGSGYSDYANGDDVGNAPTKSTDGSTGWNYDAVLADTEYPDGRPWTVDKGTEEQNGTVNMMGNVGEWLEDGSGGVRGGDYAYSADPLRSSDRGTPPAFMEVANVGVRVVAVPEPATALSLVLGGLVVAGYRRFFGRV